MSDRSAHWNKAYNAKGETEVSWYQPSPERWLGLIASAAPDLSRSIIDAGAGASRLADALLAQGYCDITALDISEVALTRAKLRLGAIADRVSWIVADITQWQPQRTWDVWHDRAVFHFLVEPAAQDAYLAALRRGTMPGSAVIMATFALDGPQRCSGLPVQRYSPATLAARLGADFSLHAEAAEKHATPFGTAQEFTYAVFRRR
jgi:SAM-dependent methyltransferase